MGVNPKMGWVKLLLIMFVLLIIILELGWWSDGCLEEERSALLHLKHNFFNDRYSPLDWVDDENYSDCCQWALVECNTTTGRVISLDLQDLRTAELPKGYLNASLFTPFQQLELLDLSFNNIAGCVENEGLEKLSRLSKLKFLDLSYNSFNNSILSSLAGLSSLRNLSLGHNKMEGSIDVEELDSLSNLEELDLSFNEIDNLVVPKDYRSLKKLHSLDLSGLRIRDGSKVLHSIGSFPSLKILSLQSNNFTETETLTLELHNFTNLEELTLDYSSLHISLLQSIASFASLKKLSMKSWVLNGVLPRDRGFFNFKSLEYFNMDFGTALNNSFLQMSKSLASLKYLSLSNSRLNGTILDQGLCELVHLHELHIDQNNLTGSLPWCLANLTSLRVLNVSFNQLTENISSLANLTSLRVLDVSFNQLAQNISSSSLMHLTSIEELWLSNNHFQIPISLEPFFNYSKLKIFQNQENQMYAEIESSHSSLTPKFQLTSISLSGPGASGTFPKFLYHQHDLEYVDLSHLNLTGEFPNWLLENNTKLKELSLVNISLSGPFRLPIHSHKNISVLNISNNNLQGHIPIEIGEVLPNLVVLNISTNAVNGSVPSSFGDMNLLNLLDLSNNQLTSKIPEHLAMGCFNLKYLVLSNNSLQGQLFSREFNLTELVKLDLDDNHFIGEIPKSLSNCSALQGLFISDNNISGNIPTWLGNLSSLEAIMMPNNRLEGPIPSEFCQLPSLKILDLSRNNLSGSFPSCVSPPSIREVHLSKNMLQGPLLDGTIISGRSLQTLDLSYNRFNGNIPEWMDRASYLSYLILANNSLEGEIPHQLCLLNHLQLMDLSHNNLSGQIPPCLKFVSFYNLPAIYDTLDPLAVPLGPGTYRSHHSLLPSMPKKASIDFTTKKRLYTYKGQPLEDIIGLDLSCNKLTGEIPPQIGELRLIHALNLSHNNLTGVIPVTFSHLEQVESLDLSYNYLNGKIPPQLIELNALAVFSVAHNNLSGKLPDRVAQFETFENDSYEGNPFLCGPPLPKGCNENGSTLAPTPEASINNEEDDCLIDMDCFYIAFAVSYVIVILQIIGVVWVNPYWRRRWFFLIEMWMTSCYYFIIDNLIPQRFYGGFMW